MSFKHKPICPKVEDCEYTYTTRTEFEPDNWPVSGYYDVWNNYEDEVFYLGFEDCKSADDKEGFLLMCSENELVQLVNHLRMIRGI